ncbi:MAG TPA: DNA polymerase III subunit alpha [Planctomycetota bacterium]|nr:DNA polymerase III subunit alpha [Planctomycetota bacterium]
MFAHLHVHSNYSFLRGASRVDELAAAAKARGMRALAITDTNGLYGVIPFYQACRKEGIKPIIGAEIVCESPLTASHHLPASPPHHHPATPPSSRAATPSSGRAVFLARNRAGYSELCRIVTARHLDEHFDLFTAICGASGNVIVVVTGGGDAARALMQRVMEHGHRARVYFEVQPIENDGTPRNARAAAELRHRRIELARWVRQRMVPVVAANNVHFVNPHQYRIHQVLRAIDANTSIESLPADAFVGRQCWLKPPERMRSELGGEFNRDGQDEKDKREEGRGGNINRDESDKWDKKEEGEAAGRSDRNVSDKDEPNKDASSLLSSSSCSSLLNSSSSSSSDVAAMAELAMANASEIAIDCTLELELGTVRFPKFPVPPGETAESYLRKVTYGGAESKYGTLADVVRARVDYELDTIISMGYADYFLIVWDIVEEAKRRRIPIVGRGSAADSIVSYVLDITRVDPIEHNLYFERFLNPERKGAPDIDLDFCWRRRDEIIEYVFRKYGEDRVAMISTYNTFGARSAIREIARALGLSPNEIRTLAERLPWGGVADVEAVVASVPEYRGLPIDKEPLKSILEIGRAIDGFPRHLSVHAGGLVIGHSPIIDFVPLQYAAKGIIITQFDMHPIEDIGLVKMDLLGQRGLSVIADTVDAVRKRYGVDIDIEAIPLDDEPTKELLRTGATMGCFQVESPGMRQLLQKLRADNMEIIIAASSVIRPGPADTGMMTAFIRRYLGKEPPVYLHPKLEPILGETFGVMLYQEDILKVASAIGGMSLGEADNLRRSMSKKRGYEGIEHEKDRFLAGAKKNGIPDDVAAEIWRQIEGFAGYAFCKAHSASYARLSWQAAWLKAHYPAEFMAAVLSNQGGYYGAWAYIEEARRMGIRILPPDVNRADRVFAAADGAIRVGLMCVKSLTEKAIRTTLSERTTRPFDSLSDLIRRVPLSLRECENLIECGGMDEFDGNRPQKIWRLQMVFDVVRRAGRRKPAAPGSGLFASLEEIEPAVPDIPDYPLAEKIAYERRVLEFCVSAHPMTLLDGRYRSGELVAIKDMARHVGETVTVAGVVISTKGTTTAKNERMKFVSLEDHSGVVEVVLFPDTYSRCGRALLAGAAVVTGKVTDDETAITLEAQTVKPLDI